MRRVFFRSLTPTARTNVNGDGGRRLAEARALLLLMLAALAASSVMAVVLASPPARAATLTVTNTNDSGAGSLREAMTEANASVGMSDTIGFAPSLAGETIILASRLPDVTAAGGALTIDGGTANITISGNDQHEVFYVGEGAKLTLDRITVANGHFNAGGGVYNYKGTLNVTNSTIADNSASVDGGGMKNYLGGIAVINVTIAQNRATGQGSGILNDNDNDIGEVTLVNTIVADNHSPSGDSNCSGPITDNDNNIDSGDSCDLDSRFLLGHSWTDTDPKLGDLANNGGPTKTMAVQWDRWEGNAAIHASFFCGGCSVIYNRFAIDPYGRPLQFDQRGQGYPRISSGAVDIGAYEYQGALTSEPPPAEVPEDKQACKKGGFREFGFRNQGQCIKAVNHAS
jgi:hypothetical protein